MALFVKTKREAKVVLLNRETSTLRVHEYRADRNLTSLAAKVWTNPDFRLMIQVVENECPLNMVLPEQADLETRALWQARVEGYLMAMANLRALSNFAEPPVQLEEEFAATE